MSRSRILSSGITIELWRREPIVRGRIGESGLLTCNAKARCVMNFGYAQPFSFKLGPRPELKVAGVRHGVTEITLSDGRLIRATLHVKAVKPNPKQPGALDVSYGVVTEVLAKPATPILDVHETIQ
jgi:hypothetical protein